MAITTYAELESAIANWLARDDLTTYIPDFITLFEAAAARRLKVRPMEVTATATTTSGIAALPDDFLGMRRVTWTGTPLRELEYVHPSYFIAADPDVTDGPPSRYTIEGSCLKIDPVDDTGLEIVYYAKNDAVSGTLNWLFTNHPDAYLFGSLAEANAFDKDVDAAGLWKMRRDEIFQEITSLDFNERGQMTVRAMSITP